MGEVLELRTILIMFEGDEHSETAATSMIFFSEDADPYSFSGYRLNSTDGPDVNSQIADLPELTIGRYIHILVNMPTHPIALQQIMCWQDRRLIPNEDFSTVEPSLQIAGFNANSNPESTFVGRDAALMDHREDDSVVAWSINLTFPPNNRPYLGRVLIFTDFEDTIDVEFGFTKFIVNSNDIPN